MDLRIFHGRKSRWHSFCLSQIRNFREISRPVEGQGTPSQSGNFPELSWLGANVRQKKVLCVQEKSCVFARKKFWVRQKKFCVCKKKVAQDPWVIQKFKLLSACVSSPGVLRRAEQCRMHCLGQSSVLRTSGLFIPRPRPIGVRDFPHFYGILIKF